MNRTQRAVKRSCKKAFASVKKQKRMRLFELKESGWGSHEKKAAALKEAAKEEKDLKSWHRKCVADYAANTSEEERTA